MPTLSSRAKSILNKGLYVYAKLGDIIETLESRIAAVEGGGLEAGSVAMAELATGIQYGSRIIASGVFTTAGGDANEAITATGAIVGDTVFVSVNTVGATPRTVTSAIAAANAINVVMSADPSTDHKLNWVVIRPIA